MSDRIPFEIITEIDFVHHGLLASKLGKRASTNPGAIQKLGAIQDGRSVTLVFSFFDLFTSRNRTELSTLGQGCLIAPMGRIMRRPKMIAFHTSVTAFALSIAIIGSSPASAVDRTHWTQLPSPAFHEMFAYYCAPAQIVKAALPTDAAPIGDAAEIHDGLLIAEYGGDCRAFYFNEIVRRIDVPTQQGLIVVNR